MDEKVFKEWLEINTNYGTARTYVARCTRVENEMNVNLDEEYLIDKGEKLMRLLKYSRQEQRERKVPKCGITFKEDVDAYIGMNSIRVSIKKYFEYLELSKFSRQENN